MDTFQCPHCGRQHKKGARFCPSTGKPLAQAPQEKYCPRCVRLVPIQREDSRFCPLCGGRLVKFPLKCPYKDCGREFLKILPYCPDCYRKLRNCGNCGKPYLPTQDECTDCRMVLPPLSGGWKTFKGGAARLSFTEEPIDFPLRKRWIFQDPDGKGAVKASPLVLEGTLYLAGTGGNLHAFNQYNGSRKWSKPMDSPLISTPVVEEGYIYQATSQGKVYCLDREKGLTRWVFPQGKRGVNAVDASLLLSGQNLIVAAMKGKIYCLDRETGKSRWVFPAKAGESLGHILASPAATDGKIVIATEEGTILCLREEDGSLLWRFPAGENLGSRVLSTPALSQGLVYFAERSGNFYALNLTDGEDAWQLPTRLEGIIEGSPAAAGNRVFIGTWESYLYSLDPFSGGIQWKYRNENLREMDCIVSTPLATAAGQVLFGGNAGYLYVRSFQNEDIWKYRLDSPLAATPIISDGFLYAMSENGVLYALSQ